MFNYRNYEKVSVDVSIDTTNIEEKASIIADEKITELNDINELNTKVKEDTETLTSISEDTKALQHLINTIKKHKGIDKQSYAIINKDNLLSNSFTKLPSLENFSSIYDNKSLLTSLEEVKESTFSKILTFFKNLWNGFVNFIKKIGSWFKTKFLDIKNKIIKTKKKDPKTLITSKDQASSVVDKAEKFKDNIVKVNENTVRQTIVIDGKFDNSLDRLKKLINQTETDTSEDMSNIVYEVVATIIPNSIADVQKKLNYNEMLIKQLIDLKTPIEQMLESKTNNKNIPDSTLNTVAEALVNISKQVYNDPSKIQELLETNEDLKTYVKSEEALPNVVKAISKVITYLREEQMGYQKIISEADSIYNTL